MKKLLSVIVSCAMLALMLLPVGAADWTTSEIKSELETHPDWIDTAAVVELEDQFVDGESNAIAASQEGLFSYVYLKDLGKGDYSVKFTVDKDGLYNIGFMLMAWSKSVNRTTNVKIDDSQWIRIEYDYTDDDQFSEQYWTGPQIELTAGEHTLTLSLTEDFDNENVKSLYFDKFYYAPAGESTAEAAPAETAPAVVKPASADVDTYQEYPEDRASGEELLFAPGGEEYLSGYDAKGGIDVDLWNLRPGGEGYCPKRDSSVWYDFEVKEATEVTYIIEYVANAGKERGVDYAVDDPNGENRVFIDLVESDDHQWVVGTFTVEAGKHTFHVYAPTGMDDVTLKSCDVFCVELYGNPVKSASAEAAPTEPAPVESAPVESAPAETAAPVQTETAPQTPDLLAICLASAAVSGLAAAVTKKKR